jgi:hypothetical protein
MTETNISLADRGQWRESLNIGQCEIREPGIGLVEQDNLEHGEDH